MIKLAAAAPWAKAGEADEATVLFILPGLNLSRDSIDLPGSVEVAIPAEALPGCYYFEAKTDRCLPLWRVLRVTK